ncbi:MAG: hypothetical protein E7255_04515 [Lachnospiraceae bacterium]|jgi:cellulose synthase/poly-beta-1,6-N-acetylglucosamine synthase-like glycosyltransferase|nr:hypothetical protein [Lachnospiraceae bacterium]
MKTRKVGTFTLGALLIVFGVLFLLRIFFHNLSYIFIFKLWPIIFISLGVEILISNFLQSDENNTLVYDKTAFVLIIILSFFAMGMAITEVCIHYANVQISPF